MTAAKRHTRIERGVFQRETEDGTRFEFNYTDSDGRTRWETVRTLAQARKQRAAKIAAVDRGELVIGRSKATFGELAEEWYAWKSTRVRPRTDEYNRDALDLVLLPRFERTRVGRIDVDAVAKLMRDLEREGLHALDAKRPVRPLGRSSIDNYLKPLQGVLKLALRRRLIAANPFDVLTSDDRPKREEREPAHEWTNDELAALLDASSRLARRPESRYDYTPLVRLTARLGLRCGEVLGLRWEDFDKDESALHVRRQWLRSGEYGPTKTPAGVRRLALPEDVRDELIELRLASRFSKNEDPIFASRLGSPLMHRNTTRRGFEPARDLAGLPGSITFHDLRDAVASKLIAAGLDPVALAAFLGHEDANVTLGVYAHLYDRRRTDDAVRVALAVAY